MIKAYYFKYLTTDLIINFFAGILLSVVVQLFDPKGLSIKYIISFAVAWSLIFSLFQMVYYTYGIKKMGYKDLDPDKLSAFNVWHKSSSTTIAEILNRIEEFRMFRDFKIKSDDNTILMNPKLLGLNNGNSIIIECLRSSDSRPEVKIEFLQKSKFILGDHYYNLKNLRMLQSYIK